MDLLKLRKPLMSLYGDGYVLGAGYGMENPGRVGRLVVWDQWGF